MIVKDKIYRYSQSVTFEVKALADSNGENFEAIVIDCGTSNYELGVKSKNWGTHLFTLVEDKFVDGDGQPFVVGAWYKITLNNRASYRRCSELPIEDYLSYSEGIEDGTRVGCGASMGLSRMKRVEASEAEKYINKEEFDLTTDKGRIAYAKKHYPIGTKVISLFHKGNLKLIIDSDDFKPTRTDGIHVNAKNGNGLLAVVHENGKWVEIIKEEKMEIQKLTRQGLKEIHGVACTRWQNMLENYGTRNPLEDYVELTQDDVNRMFKACTPEQLPIVSKYLKNYDDGSVDLSNATYDESGVRLNNSYLLRYNDLDCDNKSFWLNSNYDWEVKIVNGYQRLVPTKKK